MCIRDRNGIDSKNEKLKKFSDRIYNEIMKIDRVHLNGDREKRLSLIHIYIPI